MTPAPFTLPPPGAAAVSAPRGPWLLRARAGRVLCGLLAVKALEWAGVPLPDVVVVFANLILFGYACWGGLRLFGWISRLLFWRVRTKLFVSYLFIAVVPVVLLLLLAGLAGIIFLSLMAAHTVTTEVRTRADTLRTAARAALPGLPAGNAAAGQALGERLAALRGVHPGLAYALVRDGRTAVKVGNPSTTVPGWIPAEGFAGLVADGEDEYLRAVEKDEQGALVLQVPVDEKLFAELERTMTIRMLTKGGEVKVAGGDITVNVDDDRARRVDGRTDNLKVEGWPFVAPTERRDWATGETSLDPLSFAFQPRELVRRLSPGTADVARILVQALGVVAAIFLVMYFVALLVGLLLARSITKSIHALHRGTDRLRRGDLATVIPVYGRDQLAELAQSFNLMSRGIQQLLVEQAEKERLAEELRIARQIQMKLLPQGKVSLPGLRIAALCLPAAEVGGDYYDLLPLTPTRMGVLVADVSGKGTSAALYMAELKGLVLSLSCIYDSPARLLVEANRILCANMDSRSFITMTYAVVDTGARTMRYARAGHNPLIHLQARTGATHVLAPPGLGLGIDRHGRFEEILEEATVPLEEGDVFVFFTDGISEAMNTRSELFGELRLRDLVKSSEALSSEEMKEAILEDIRTFVGEAAQHDDMTMVIVKVVAEAQPALEPELPAA
jgi:serine phosphatase RsbU (regulator of sigma subunit)